MRERAPDLIGAVLLVALGLAFALGALSSYEVIGRGGRIGPGFMPFSTGILLAVFGAMVGAGAWMGRSRGRDEAGIGEGAGEPEDGGARNTVAAVFGLTLVAILLTSVLGFLASFGLLVFALVKFVERRSLLVGAAVGAGAVVFTWLVFEFFLQIPLPGGVFAVEG